ncbi:MAG TPA: hypothetical protein VFV34_15940 [Blastocatellia bacterium]|nr:hypothetical protein [Blastocatellia bacterium]
MTSMARIMYWNVEQYSINKVDSTQAPDQGDVADNGTMGTDRLDFILNTLQPGNGAIDIFVLVELKPGTQNNAQGNLVDDNAGVAARMLLTEMRNQINNAYRLVPPVVSGGGGRREAVAVYYNSNTLHFLGPVNNGAAYGAPWNNALPNRVVPPAYPVNGGLNERNLGGQIAFQSRVADAFGNIPGAALEFPLATFRRPFLTYFGEFLNPNRLIKVLAYHSSPNSAQNGQSADLGTAQLANIWEMSNQPVPGGGGVAEVDVILGDFNVQADDANFINNGPYADLVAGVNAPNPLAVPYAPLLRVPNGFPNADLSYFSTHFRQLNNAHIENGALPLGSYPGFDYMDRANGSIDNVFLRVQNGVLPANNITIFNRVTGTPYNPPHNNAPAGHYQSATAMATDLNTMFANLFNDPDNYNADGDFRDWDNYGKIRSTSDHLPLIFDV